MNNRTDTMTATGFRQLIAGGKTTGPVSQPTSNRKVRNAAKIECKGVVFDCRIEKYMNDLPACHGVPAGAMRSSPA